MERLYSWVALTALSVVILAALVDHLPSAVRGSKENFTIAAACISLIFGFLVTIGFVVDSLGNLIIGNVVESAIATVVLGLWVFAIAFIQNPQNDIATAIAGSTEVILSANLYFFSWLTFLTAVYIVGVSFQDVFRFGPKFTQWVLLLTASIILMSTSIAVREEICSNAAAVTCERTKYAVAVGAIGMVISFLAVVASVMDKMSRLMEIGATVLSTILYFFGVIFLTSANGPASSFGNMYFSVWGGCFASFALLVGVLFPNAGRSSEQEGGTSNSNANTSGNNQEEDNI
mmetsp:Transcript_16725/g.31692  ORF Transcript_16725/g.31692 Transcript_16725/m.31692 type:complete len:289 (+) Transcript_16725:197-1063(+)|eukprot:CAMPEP_0176491122 /NCGR_PEP_ID=MMETSP0200_2-20121128/8256_1 /TAXON_ID=947934 /ORGANISM="Chaetoceros sp., Strain GSL56" /LENGTH=288 /DNA_ID=CAMNT_0017888515 /DNA_START=132 /DNA_END=998 /DNA_ORIENTATION=+